MLLLYRLKRLKCTLSLIKTLQRNKIKLNHTQVTFYKKDAVINSN